MILRPLTKTDLLELIAAIASDDRLELDTRTMLLAVLTASSLQNFPHNVALTELLKCKGKRVGPFRLGRLLSDARAAGYLAPANWRLPREGRRLVYRRVFGRPSEVAEALSQLRAARP